MPIFQLFNSSFPLCLSLIVVSIRYNETEREERNCNENVRGREMAYTQVIRIASD